MSDKLSSQIMARMRVEAQSLGRPEIRLATLARLEEACNAIADGSAAAVIKKWKADAYPNWTRSHIPIIPPRIEDYVLARQAKDRASGETPSKWTGPVASSLRKEANAMLAYVRARDDEKKPAELSSARTKRAYREWWQLVDGIEDDLQRSELLRELSRGREATAQNTMLRKATHMLSANFDLEAYLRGEPQGLAGSQHDALPPPAELPDHDVALSAEDAVVLAGLLKRLTDPLELGGFDLETDGKRVLQRKSRAKLIEATELNLLRRLVKGTP